MRFAGWAAGLWKWEWDGIGGDRIEGFSFV